MDVEKFNKKVLNDNAINLPDSLRQRLENNENDDLLYEICREFYLVAYESSIIKSGEEIGMHISDEAIKNLSKKFKISAELLFDKIDFEHYGLLLSVIESFYIKTATSKEREHKAVFIRSQNNLMFQGRLYNTDIIIDWNEFSDLLIKELK